jgi:hypothetical protein
VETKFYQGELKMLPSHGDFLVRQEQYQDLLREAERERLIQAAELRQAGKWGLKLQAHRSSTPTCCGDCCRVELKVNASM